MSRGAGALQRRILAALAALPEGEIDRGLSLSGIGARLGPVDPSNLRRALKGLAAQGRVERAYAEGGPWRLPLWPRAFVAMERYQTERAASEREGVGNPMDAGKPHGRRRAPRDRP